VDVPKLHTPDEPPNYLPRRGKDVSHMLIHERGWIDEAQSTERRTFFKNLPLLQTASDFPLEGTPSPCGVGSNDG
jgi:hypothetical protein